MKSSARLRRAVLSRGGQICAGPIVWALVVGPLHFASKALVCTFFDCSKLETCTSSGGVVSNTTTGIQVILPSVGQTGTTSVVEALSQMGYRTFHADDKGIFMPEANMDYQVATEFAAPLSRCKVEALALEPGTDAYPAIMEISPQAKVIMTWRPYPSWLPSTTTGGVSKDQRWVVILGLALHPLFVLHLFPVIDYVSGAALKRALKEAQPLHGAGVSPVSLLLKYVLIPGYNPEGANIYQRGVFKISAGEEGYLAHHDEIRRLGAGRLLEFDVKKHGWAELAEFLGRPAPPGEVPFPHPRSIASWTNDALFDNNLDVGLRLVGASSALGLLSIFITGRVASAAFRTCRSFTRKAIKQRWE